MRSRVFSMAVVGVALLLASRRAGAQAPMEPNRAARIRVACDAVRGPDIGHYVVAGALITVGGALFVPNLIDSSRGDIGFFQQGVGLGLAVGGAVLLLRPYGAGGIHLFETCLRLTRPRDYDNPVVLRDAERYLNALAVSQRSWDLLITVGAAVVSIGGGVLSALLFDPTHATTAAGARSASQQRAFYIGAFAAVPLGFLADLLVLPPPVRAAVEFHRGGFRSPPTLTLRPMLLPNGIGVAGAF